MAYRALLLGASTFDDDSGLVPLKGPPNDLSLMLEALAHPELGLHRREEVESHLNRTQREMLEVMEKFFSAAAPDDQLLLYYTGHGVRDNFNNLYLCARDSHRDRPIATAVSDAQINALVQQSASTRVVIILDCCYSGSFKGSEDIPERLGSGRFVLTSSRRSELSDDAGKDADASVFTRFLVDAILATDTDSDGDGFVSLGEVYNQMLPRLRGATKQVPQRNYDNTVGDPRIARARARVRVEAPLAGPPQPPAPELEVSEAEVNLRGVQLGEKLPPEAIDVYDKHGGTIDWTVEADADWIRVTKKAGFFELELAPPRVGNNRGAIYVRATGRGGSKKIRVVVEVVEPVVKPMVVEPDTVDLGTLAVGGTATRRTLRTRDSRADLRATCDDDRISVRVVGELIDISAAALAPGPKINASIHVTSAGGSAVVPVKGVIDSGPVLVVKPRETDFGEVRRGEHPSRQVTVRNSGSGRLEWRSDVDRPRGFFDVTDRAQQLAAGEVGTADVQLGDAQEGVHRGSIRITSNGGEATIGVRATIVAPPQAVVPSPPPPVPQAPMAQAPQGIIMPGTWRIDVSAFGVTSSQLVLDLHPTGALAGTMQTMGMNMPVQGRWMFDLAARQLGLEVYGPGFGDVVGIQIVGQQGNVLQGHNGAGFTYALTRVG